MANIDITSTPPGANIYINSTDTFQVTPSSLDLLPGDHTYQLKLTNYVDIIGNITITAGIYYILNVPLVNNLEEAAKNYYDNIIKLYAISIGIAVIALLPAIFRKSKT